MFYTTGFTNARYNFANALADQQRWEPGMNTDGTVWVPTVFSKNPEQRMNGDVAEKFFAAVLQRADTRS